MDWKYNPDDYISAHDQRYIDLAERCECYRAARLEYFRARVKTMIRHVSPMVHDALADMGLRTADVIDRFRVPDDWPEKSLRTHDTFRPGGYDFLSGGRLTDGGGSERWHRRFARRHQGVAGCVICDPDDRDDRDEKLGFRLCGEGLEIALLTSTYLLTSSAGKGRLHVAQQLPLTIGSAMVGRPVGAIVSHPLLAGRDYPVKRVMQPVGGTSLIVFETGSTAVANE
ncbi:hypothetical protein [Sphingomonas albertensis]|uniref:Uncharacterized protein n=1 Tax=Sphingomonas albertensis TaxID=2762591 RepID=A0ABR7AJK0_9SPHN|nr:hypothetical protein [Sphingomonas albertensis]MBC3940625.1 hypothetical protein [Sphingomonas albertensis]